MRELIDTLGGVAGRKPPSRALPTAVLKAIAPAGPLVGKLTGQPPNLRELISSADGVTFWAKHDRAISELGYSPRGLETGLSRHARGRGQARGRLDLASGSADLRLGLDLDHPARVDERCDDDHRRRRLGLAEELAMGLADGDGELGIGDEHRVRTTSAGRASSSAERRDDDLEAAPRLGARDRGRTSRRARSAPQPATSTRSPTRTARL